MHKCCSVYQEANRPQRRLNGLQLPLNYQQVIGWIVFVVTGALNMFVLIEIQFEMLKRISLVTYIILYVSHIMSHLTASLLDPSEKELRKLEVNTVPEFDRNVHAHVIENGRCHLCNIFTSSKKTKHCSICNKCVDRFDHHCKWLNSCVGRRNYGAFLASVVTALALSLMTSSLCFIDIVLILSKSVHLSPWAQHIIDCNPNRNLTDIYNDTKLCHNSILVLIFLIIFCVSALAIACALLHLFCFHIYISVLGVSTYEYILRSGTLSTMPQYVSKCNCCRIFFTKKIYRISKSKSNNINPQGNIDEEITNTGQDAISKTGSNQPQMDTEKNVASFISILVSNELIKARKIFMYEKNKIHPQEESS